MEKFRNPVEVNKSITVGSKTPVIIAGPCAAESYELCKEVGMEMKQISEQLNFQYIFKSSFDKANRTSVQSYRGPGLDEGIKLFEKLKSELDLSILTDVHESGQCNRVAEVVDVLQIPAFLCRQTDLLIAAGKTGKTVNVKRGQFMAPEDMQYGVTKVKSTGNEKVFLTERGATFGYNNLVVDYRALPIMRQYAPVIFDVTHSVQMPGAAGGSSGGKREFAPYLARAAAAVGVDGFFIETHPDPAKAKSDGPNMIPLGEMKEFLKMILEYFRVELGR
jgi:2-dehydro-3-deoxyphosphooctonate aldolase (KDO 8-P synthase)